MGYYEKFKTQTVYLYNDEEDIYLRSDPEKGWFAKRPGGKEYKISDTSKVVVLGMDMKKEVTKQQYENA